MGALIEWRIRNEALPSADADGDADGASSDAGSSLVRVRVRALRACARTCAHAQGDEPEEAPALCAWELPQRVLTSTHSEC